MKCYDAVNKRIKQNNFFYTQLTFVFHFQKDFYIVQEHIDAFRFYLLQKDSDTFNEPFVEVFLCFLDNILLTFSYIGKKFIRNVLFGFFTCFKKLPVPYELCKLYELC